MGASLQSLGQQFSEISLAAGIFSSGGLWVVFWVHWQEVEVEESSWTILAG
jgi:hypothetical protein